MSEFAEKLKRALRPRTHEEIRQGSEASQSYKDSEYRESNYGKSKKSSNGTQGIIRQSLDDLRTIRNKQKALKNLTK